ncbi:MULTISPECIES: hypothetical protein [unclassified Crossiella]|uniref:hypothetical protein n=1 Tax=unclassified Crossiella TaxID=2620835 RepID=UPI001FFE6F24|nr:MULTISPECIES: hypothetical protein [unclassified Crossiella]MCK2245316.1 hypothetical protein [Crossiella sp. S99.2]MCK2258982.1 hypothetical protein [Crossiella sp. S99.1]
MVRRGVLAATFAGLAMLAPVAAQAAPALNSAPVAASEAGTLETRTFTGQGSAGGSPKRALRQAMDYALQSAAVAGYLESQCVTTYSRTYSHGAGYFSANVVISCTR